MLSGDVAGRARDDLGTRIFPVLIGSVGMQVGVALAAVEGSFEDDPVRCFEVPEPRTPLFDQRLGWNRAVRRLQRADLPAAATLENRRRRSSGLAERTPAGIVAIPTAPDMIHHKHFQGTLISWSELFDKVAARANELEPEQFVSVSHSDDGGNGVVTLWYWDAAPDASHPDESS